MRWRQEALQCGHQGLLEHTAAVPWACADVLTGLCKQISSMVPDASGFPSTLQTVKLSGSESGLSKFESQPFYVLAGDLSHMLLNLLFWSQFPHVKENGSVNGAYLLGL